MFRFSQKFINFILYTCYPLTQFLRELLKFVNVSTVLQIISTTEIDYGIWLPSKQNVKNRITSSLADCYNVLNVIHVTQKSTSFLALKLPYQDHWMFNCGLTLLGGNHQFIRPTFVCKSLGNRINLALVDAVQQKNTGAYSFVPLSSKTGAIVIKKLT